MRIRQTLSRLRGDNSGAFAVLAAIMFVPIFGGMAATGVDMSMWYRHIDQMQTAADAAALAGAPALPGNPDLAKSMALDYAARNGYSNDGTTTVTAELSDAPNEIRVTIDTEVPNSFGALLGHPTQRLIRSSEADYSPGLETGGLCNILGNEPNDSGGGTWYQGWNTSSNGPDPCRRNAGFYLRAGFPGSTSAITDKAFGDRYLTKLCKTAGTYGCEGGQNGDYSPTGYFYKLHVSKPGRVHLQAYDPAMIHTGTTCADMPRGVWAANNTLNPFVTDARTRYAGAAAATPDVPPNSGTGAGSQVSWCTGDFSGYLSSITPSVAGTDQDAAKGNGGTTLYGVRADNGGGDPMAGELLGGCEKKFNNYVGDLSQALDQTKAGYNATVARTFHQWVDLCSFDAPAAGDYWIQVRTDQPSHLSDLTAALNSRTPGSSTAAGLNGYSLRARIDAEYGTNSSDVLQISAQTRLAMFMNAASTRTFWLARVTPENAGRTMTVSMFDVGDISDSGSVTARVFDGGGQTLSNCTASGPGAGYSGLKDTCQISGMRANTHNGKVQLLHVPIPANYTCNVDDPRSCWLYLSFSISGGVTNSYDTVSWSVGIDADPVRLTK